jgi:hypothetical protein
MMKQTNMKVKQVHLISLVTYHLFDQVTSLSEQTMGVLDLATSFLSY